MLPLPSRNLPSQIEFGFLSVSDWELAACAPDDAMDLGETYLGGSASPNKTALLVQNLSFSISSEAYVLLAAAQASADHQAAILKAGVAKHIVNANDHGSTLQCSSDERFDPERVLPSMAPPKRFYRTFWRSLSFRLLRRSSYMAGSSR